MTTNNNEHFSLREQLTDMQIKIERISEKLIELSVINSQTLDERKTNAVKLEKLESDFLSTKGAIGLLKGLLTMFGASGIAFCTWIVTSNMDTQKNIYETNQKIGLLESKVEHQRNDLSKLENRVEEHNENKSNKVVD